MSIASDLYINRCCKVILRVLKNVAEFAEARFWPRRFMIDRGRASIISVFTGRCLEEKYPTPGRDVVTAYDCFDADIAMHKKWYEDLRVGADVYSYTSWLTLQAMENGGADTAGSVVGAPYGYDGNPNKQWKKTYTN